MRKIFVMFLSLMLIISLAACGHKNDSDGSIPLSQSSTTSDSGNKMPKSTVSTETSSTGEGASVQDARIKLTFGNEEVFVKMYDNPTSRDLLAQLPLTLSFKDYAGTEKISYLPQKLSTEGSPSGYDPSVAELAYYAPWGNICFYYRDFGYSNGLVPLGSIESGMESLTSLDGDFKVTIEKY